MALQPSRQSPGSSLSPSAMPHAMILSAGALRSDHVLPYATRSGLASPLAEALAVVAACPRRRQLRDVEDGRPARRRSPHVPSVVIFGFRHLELPVVRP